MNESFKPIIETLVKEGFHQLTDSQNQSAKALDFNITPYSLNSKLSFKFENLEHFKEFLKISNHQTETDELALLDGALLQLGLKPEAFFYVNFFEKGKELEM